MYKYEDTHTNVSGTFPDTLAKNVTTPGAGDGTEYIAAQVNDNWGFHQALMDYAGLTPDSVTEAPGTSQMVEALQKGFGHPGEVVLWHGQADPATLGLRLLILQGQGVLRVDYPELDEACYVGDANNPDTNYKGYYHADDAAGTSRNIAGPYLILPECRGLFLRGWDPTGIHDQYGATRHFPDRQWHAFEVHTHKIYSSVQSYYAEASTFAHSAGATVYFEGKTSPTGEVLIADEITGGASSSNVETRSKNYSVKICVRY